MNTEQRIVRHAPSNINHWGHGRVSFGPNGEIASDDTAGHDDVIRAASREEAKLSRQRDMKRVVSLTSDMLAQKPVLPKDHSAAVARLEASSYETGVSFDPPKVPALGLDMLAQLSHAAGAARAERAVGSCDLTSFESCKYAFAVAGVVPSRRSSFEKFSDHNRDLDDDVTIRCSSFAGIWQFYPAEPRAVARIDDFQRLFTRLVFGQSLYTWLQPDTGRIHNRRLAANGLGEQARLFEAWLPALKGPHYIVRFEDLLASLIFWLAEETTPPPSSFGELAKACRLPSADPELAASVFEGFCLGKSGSALIEHAGREIRKVPNEFAVAGLEDLCRRRFPQIAQFYQELTGFFYRGVNDLGERQLEPAKRRDFIDRLIGELKDRTSEVAALCIQEHSDANTVAARFSDSILCAGKPKPEMVELLTERLASVFPAAVFNLRIQDVEEVQPSGSLPPAEHRELSEFDKRLCRLFHHFSGAESEGLSAEHRGYTL